MGERDASNLMESMVYFGLVGKPAKEVYEHYREGWSFKYSLEDIRTALRVFRDVKKE